MQGNAFFKAADYNSAVQCYSDVVAILDQDFLFIPEIKEQSRALKMAAGESSPFDAVGGRVKGTILSCHVHQKGNKVISKRQQA